MSEFETKTETARGGSHARKSSPHSAGRASRLIAVALLCCLLGGFAFAGTDLSAAAEPASATVLSAADIYEQNVNSTVGITISAQITSRYYGTQTYAASGSGFIITEDGYILTNYHVIEDYDTVTVAAYDGTTYDAEVVGYDESNDIAVLKIDAEGLTPVTFGDSDALRVGEDVYAIGNPLGELTFSLTRGIVSALSRNIKVESGNTMSLIQTDCAINSGNSGGALFNSAGEVIGITNAKYSSSGSSSEASIDNIGFAIPINSVKRIVNSIIENGYILKPFIGVSVSTISDDVKSVTGIDSGAWVREITEDGPAAEAGLQVNDIIVKVDDQEITSSSDLVSLIGKSEPGETLKFTVYRQGQEITIDVEIGSKTEAALKETEEVGEEIEEDDSDFGGSHQSPNYYNFGGSGNGANSMEDFFNYYFGYGF